MTNSKKMIFEGTVKELKNHYTINETIKEVFGFVNAPIMKKVLYGFTIQKPTSYRVYEYYNEQGERKGSYRTWVFGEIETNPSDRSSAEFLSIK